MKLKIPKEKAIEILKKRKSELNSTDFEPSVWKATTENDCREIFDGMDFKWLNISQINFTTPFSQEKYAVMEEGKTEANKFIDSFIQQINEYAVIEQMKAVERENYYEKEYKELEQQTTHIIAQTNELIKDQNKYLDELKEQDAEIERLNRETVQLSNISLSKLFKLIGNLTLVQSIGFVTTFIGIISFAIYCGTLSTRHNHVVAHLKKG